MLEAELPERDGWTRDGVLAYQLERGYRVDRRSSAPCRCATGPRLAARARRKTACGPIGRALIKQYR